MTMDEQQHQSTALLSHPTIKDGWFTEVNDEWPGQGLMIKVKKILFTGKSKFQDVLVFESTNHGNILVLDGVVQVAESDEFAYQEMLTHLALNSHPNPRRVLVVGGGDGGVLREIVKHECVEEAILVEIDNMVLDVAAKYLPDMSSAFNHPKVTINVGDGFKYLEDIGKETNNSKKFDVIITDSSDPEGPAALLFQKSFYELLYNSLAEDGVMSCQVSENQWLNLDLIRDLKTTCKTVFPVVEYSYTCVPTYTSGQLGLFVCSKDPSADVKVPLRTWDKKTEETLNKYYNKEMHAASFVLPTWAKNILK